MILSIHQPSYWPWLGLLYKIACSETFVLLDDVAANKASNQYRNTFFCSGIEKYLTLPVNYSLGIKLIDLEFRNWQYLDEHLSKLKNYYLKAPYLAEGMAIAERALLKMHDKPVTLITDTMLLLMDALNIKTRFIRSSDLGVSGAKDELVLDICLKTFAGTYISGMGGLGYINNYNMFDTNKINIRFISYEPINYPQDKRFTFVKGLSALDLIMFNGVEESRKIFWQNLNNNIKLLTLEQVS